MARVLILGGTRNLGHVTATTLLRAGHEVAVLNRGVTADELPLDVERLHASRQDHAAVRSVVDKRNWDCIIDTTTYTGRDAAAVCDLFRDRCDRIIFISTGQVYLVRRDISPPYKELDFDGPIIPEPAPNTSDQSNWVYGVDKREAEKVFAVEGARGTPVVSLRLPMIASERDHYGRIQGYIARARDGGPILVPDDESLPIRHVYVEDVANVIKILCTDEWRGFQAFNISFGESMTLEQFFELLGRELGTHPESIRIPREKLVANDLLPGCSPYSGRWMSELDNALGVRAFPSLRYTAPAEYIARIASDYDRWIKLGLNIPGYDRRRDELDLAKKHG
jgi:nucleoside-diphosphate-sugar epimerase